MRTFLLATVVSVAFAFPALAQTQTQPAPPTPPTHSDMAKPATQMQAGANMQNINPNTLSRHQVMQIQQALDKSGFSAGRTDGMWGSETRSALMNFQKSKNMGAANGELNDQTLAALNLNPGEFAQNQRGAAPMGKAP